MRALFSPFLRTLAAAAAVTLLLLAGSPPALAAQPSGGGHGGSSHAGGGHGGGGHYYGHRGYYGWHGGWGWGWGVGIYEPWWPGYWWPYYYGPGYYGDVYYDTAPGATIVQPAAPPSYYYCANPAGYYPYVQTCQVPWRPVPVTPQQ